ncbi:MAG: alpha/beta hydrolase [Bacteroidales bacterium]|jgi:acetyl esterase/lipase|nr:alpha/beta hydrolase [Bacteroidales bacterium]
MRKAILFFGFLFFVVILSAQNNSVYLWKDIPPMKKEKSRLYTFIQADSLKRGISVIICPGGSYAHLYGIKREGFEVAQWLNANGITAFVLKYRVGKDGYHHPAMIEDVQRAIQWVRTHAADYNINPDCVGVMGFSAGGHLSLMAGTFYQENYLAKWGIETVNLKPAFVVPVYPVVSMQDSLAHVRSRKNLLGKDFGQKEKDKFSMELQIKEDMPPVFLVTTKDDPVVNYKNSLALDNVLKKKEIPCKFLLYETGGHGFGMNDQKGGDAAQWKNHFIDWLYEIKILK